MVTVRRSAVIDAPVEVVWAALRDFNGHDRWHPAVVRSRIEEEGQGDQVGAVRDFRLSDGARIREQLLAHSDSQRAFRYCILEAPIPLHGYVAEMRLRPVTDVEACFVEWQATFEPPGAQRSHLATFVGESIMEAGLQGLRDAVSGRRVASPSAVRHGDARGEGAEATAVILSRHGGPDVLSIERVRAAEPQAGEVRIRQTAIGVNFIDVYCRRGSFDLVPPGGVLGMEAAGVVERVGAGVSHVRVGERVGYACAPPGAYASMRTMQADLLVRLPDSLSDIQAAALLLKGITASFLLHDVYAVQPGSRVFVHAAAGGVGQILCRWAKALGAFVIGATSSETKADEARRVGCDAVLLYGRDDIGEAAMRLSGGHGMDVIYDAVGRDTFEASLRALAPRGHLVSFGQASGDVGAQSIDRLAGRSVTLSRPNYVHYTDTPERLKRQTDRLFAALRAGIVIAERPRTYPLAEVAAAHADLEGRRTTGALVLVP
jgi:NADPH:quinone reductase